MISHEAQTNCIALQGYTLSSMSADDLMSSAFNHAQVPLEAYVKIPDFFRKPTACALLNFTPTVCVTVADSGFDDDFSLA